MAIETISIEGVFTGPAVPYTRPGSMSAIHKSRRAGAVRAVRLGLEGDEQGDRRVHGGVDKAIHHYPRDHYAYWRTRFDSPLLEVPPAFGENITSSGWTEASVCLGDRVRAGDVLLEVSQARQPCWKLDARLGHAGVARSVQGSGRTGWYYRVLESGLLAEGDDMRIIDRPFPDWPLSRLVTLLFERSLDRDELAAASQLPLPPGWRKLLERRLASGAVESWDARLEGAKD